MGVVLRGSKGKMPNGKEEKDMTKQEARNHFKLKDTDVVYKDGVKNLLEISKSRLGIWSLTSDMRQEIQTDIDACEALLKD